MADITNQRRLFINSPCPSIHLSPYRLFHSSLSTGSLVEGPPVPLYLLVDILRGFLSEPPGHRDLMSTKHRVSISPDFQSFCIHPCESRRTCKGRCSSLLFRFRTAMNGEGELDCQVVASSRPQGPTFSTPVTSL